jgi:hypothetical protein
MTITAVPTLTATEMPQPVPIGFSPEEAEREMLARFDPRRHPRIEWSTVLSRASYLAVNPSSQFVTEWGSNTVGPALRFPDSLVLVAASTCGLKSQSPSHFEGDGTEPSRSDDCGSAYDGQRETVVTVFDALSGHAITAALVRDEYDRSVVDIWRSMPRLRTRRVDRPTATPSATGPPISPPDSTPTEPSADQRLTRGTMPEALRTTFEGYPLRPGSSWTWRVTDHWWGVYWTVEVITETVEAAWRSSDDRAKLRLRVERQLIVPLSGERSEPPTTYRIYRDVGPHWLSAEPEPFDGEGHPIPTDDERLVVEPAGDPFAPEWFNDGAVFEFAHDVPVKVPAGDFTGCTRFGVETSASGGTVRWFCPGIGYVRDEGYHAYNGGYVVFRELVAWHIADW